MSSAHSARSVHSVQSAPGLNQSSGTSSSSQVRVMSPPGACDESARAAQLVSRQALQCVFATRKPRSTDKCCAESSKLRAAAILEYR